MSEQTALKAQSAWLIRAVLIIHAMVFAYVAFEPFVLVQLAGPEVLEKASATLAPASLSFAIIVLAKLILLGLVPARLRDRLVHWRWQHPLPGARAFSKLGPADPRVDMVSLEQIYGPLPTDPGEQGRLFYKIYSRYTAAIGVLDAHKSYLAARDVGIINLLLCCLLPGLVWWATQDLTRTAIYAAALVLSYILMALTAQVYGARLVENALAAASAGHS